MKRHLRKRLLRENAFLSAKVQALKRDKDLLLNLVSILRRIVGFRAEKHAAIHTVLSKITPNE